MPSEWLEPIVLEEEFNEGTIEAIDAVKYAYAERVCANMEESNDFNYCDGGKYQQRSLSYTEVLINIYNNLKDIKEKYKKKKEKNNNSEFWDIVSDILSPYISTDNKPAEIDFEKLIKKIAKIEYPDIEFRKNFAGYFYINPRRLNEPKKLNTLKIISDVFQDGEEQTISEALKSALKPAQKLFDKFDEICQWTTQKRNIQQNFWHVRNGIRQISKMKSGKKIIWEKHPYDEDVMLIRRSVELLFSPTLTIKSRKEIEINLANCLYRYGCILKRREATPYRQHLKEEQLKSAAQALKAILDLKEKGLLEDYKSNYERFCKNEEDFKNFTNQIFLSLENQEKQNLLNDTHKNILRSTFDGYISTVNNVNLLSSDLIRAKDSFLSRPKSDVDYKSILSSNEVWNICQKDKAFQAIEEYLVKGLQSIRFPADKIKSLTYPDITWLINRGGLTSPLHITKENKEGIIISDNKRLEANKNFAEKYEKSLELAIRNYRGVYENPEIDISINVKHSDEEIECILKDIKEGRSGANCFITDFYKCIYEQVVPKEKQIINTEDLNSIKKKEKFYKQATSDFIISKFENIGYTKEVATMETEMILNNLRFKFDGHHGEEISKLAYHNDDPDFEYSSLNDESNIYQAVPEIHNTILHAFDNVDLAGSTYVNGYSKETGIAIFKNPRTEKYWQYEIVPAEHVKAFVGKSCLLVDDDFYNECKQFIIDYEIKKKEKELLSGITKKSHTTNYSHDIIHKTSGTQVLPINKRHTPKRRMPNFNKDTQNTL